MPPEAASTSQLKVDDPGANAVSTALPALQLPPGPQYTTRGTGTFSVLPGSSAVIGKGGPLYRFDLQVENGVRGVDLKQFATVVMDALSNRRSWTGTGQLSLQRVSSGPVNFHVSLSSAMTVRSLCGYSLPVETSCFDGGDSRVVLNVARWVRGAKVYASDLATYRIYAVNHEVGHALGHNHAHRCLSDGLAPVMMQQTIGTRTASGQICEANPWPYPAGAADAPGAEQAGDGPDMDFYRRNAADGLSRVELDGPSRGLMARSASGRIDRWTLPAGWPARADRRRGRIGAPRESAPPAWRSDSESLLGPVEGSESSCLCHRSLNPPNH